MDYPTLPTTSGKIGNLTGFQPLVLRKNASPLPFPAGTQLIATVLKQSPKSNFIKLLVEGKPLLAQSRQSFSTGQTLKLEVTKTGATPTLRVLSITGQHNPIRQTLMAALPKQIKLSTLYNALFFTPFSDRKSVSQPMLPRRLGNQKLAQPTAATAPNTLPAPLKALPADLHPLFMTLLNRPNIKTAEGLKQALSDSGLFLEAKLLAEPDVELTADMKANFLKLQDTLKRLTGDRVNPEAPTMQEQLDGLQKKVEGAIARIVLNQLASSPTDESSKQQWHIELPVFQEDTTTSAKLLVSRDSKSGSGEEKDQWSVDLELEPKQLGRITSRIVYFDGEISTFFQCERATTNQLINDQLETLRQRLVLAGLNPGNILAQHNETQPTEILTCFQGLVDEKA